MTAETMSALPSRVVVASLSQISKEAGMFAFDGLGRRLHMSNKAVLRKTAQVLCTGKRFHRHFYRCYTGTLGLVNTHRSASMQLQSHVS